MAAQPQPVYSAPFDAVAARYDESFTASRIGQAQRSAVWAELAKAFRPGNRILEIGCGTGVDACFLAERGVRVVACDSSEQMIAVASDRVRENGFQQSVEPVCLRAEQLSRLPANWFDGAFSNFGALNCVADLRGIALNLAKLLNPGSTALFCWMGPHCLWEMAWYLAHGNASKAFRRLKRGGVSARVADGASVWVHYPSVKTLAGAFAPEFRLVSIKGIGVTVPPSYLEPLARRHPRWLELCKRTDSWLSHCPGLRVLADHILVRLEREGSPRGGDQRGGSRR